MNIGPSHPALLHAEMLRRQQLDPRVTAHMVAASMAALAGPGPVGLRPPGPASPGDLEEWRFYRKGKGKK